MSQIPSPSSVPELKPGSLVGESFHLIGVGGVGMSVVATLLAEQGAHVTGSDVHEGPAFIELREAGREVVLGHDAANVPEDSVIVISSAIKESMTELAGLLFLWIYPAGFGLHVCVLLQCSLLYYGCCHLRGNT